MANLQTTFMGLKLKNPLIVGASSLTADPFKLSEFEDAGAIVIKSLFEEQVQLEEMELMNALEEYAERNAEMTRIFPNIKHAGPKEHLIKLKKTKENVKVPVIASLNAVNIDTWVDYAKQIEQTGVDAIELNLYQTPRSFELSGADIIESQIETINMVSNEIKIPVSVKLSPFYTNQLSVIGQMDKIEKLKGFVLFNKMYQPDINIEKETLEQSLVLSDSYDVRLAIRFAGLLYGNIKADIASAGGIMNGSDAIKTILAGSSAFQVVSALYVFGNGHIKNILNEIENWMNRKGYNHIDDFRGKLAKKNLTDPFAYRRSQYVEMIMKSEQYLMRKTLP